MSNRIVNTEFTTGTVAGTRWLHTVLIDNTVVMVSVRPSGCGYAIEADALTAGIAAQAIGVVAQAPKGR